MRSLRRLGLVILTVVLVAGCSVFEADPNPGSAPEPTTTAPPEPPPAWVPTEQEFEQARELADGLSLPELAGQLLIARHFSADSSLTLVRDHHFAGDMVTGDRILDITTTDPLSDIKAYNEQLRQIGRDRGIPTLIPIDQEGGLVARLRDPLTDYGTFMTAGAAIAGDPESREVLIDAARASGAELRGAGFNAAFAPVADLTIGPADPIIGSRSPSAQPDVAAAAVTAWVEGYGEAGILTSVKHFPGHRVAEDSHKGLPKFDASLDELKSLDLVPFLAAIELQAPAIMTGHLDVTAIDPGRPASLSRKVVTDLLRDELRYEGLIITDSLGMGAVHNPFPNGTAALEALKAGSDLALMPADNLAAHAAVLDALETGDYDEAQARDSATRVIAHALHLENTTASEAVPGSALEAATDYSAAGLTLVSCEPLEPLTSVVPRGNEAAVARFRAAAEELGLGTASGPSIYLAGRGVNSAWGDIVVSLDTPYVLAQSTAETKLALFGNSLPAMRALVRYLLGERDAPGALPVPVDVPECSTTH